MNIVNFANAAPNSTATATSKAGNAAVLELQQKGHLRIVAPSTGGRRMTRGEGQYVVRSSTYFHGTYAVEGRISSAELLALNYMAARPCIID
ncbi:hypothetical protein IC762_09645 [Bradyrhizobium genosp. L]|uniref:hypothetical protein n=1 Tax=Bradyrhizobium genosp. L TaxID=83637 RepID=UPI0018A334B8|nr:hypothetical protein [Bradyrhizobium genosp. L]QPF86518.1 hypothetical protein IC762_09645 [Bradyrhizobium genosp. L]